VAAYPIQIDAVLAAVDAARCAILSRDAAVIDAVCEHLRGVTGLKIDDFAYRPAPLTPPPAAAVTSSLRPPPRPPTAPSSPFLMLRCEREACC
jgi:hypothetical protein